MTYGEYFFFSLIFTLTVEIPITLLLLRHLFRVRAPTHELLFWDVCANLFSFPYLWFVFPLFLRAPYYIPIGEALVILIETTLLAQGLRIRMSTALAASCIANLASYYVGIFFFSKIF